MPSGADKIRFSCACGTRISAPPGSVGRRARCPKCQAVLVVPDPEPAGVPDDFGAGLLSELASGAALERPAAPPPSIIPKARTDDDRLYGLAPIEAATRAVDESRVPQGPPKKCPSCAADLPHTAKICVTCGIDLKTGRAILMKDDQHLDHAYMFAEGVIRWVSWLFFCGFYPIASEAFGTRKPWVVRGVAIVTVLVSCWYMVAYIYNSEPAAGLQNLMLWSDGDWSAFEAEFGAELSPEALDELRAHEGKFHGYQLLTHALLHGDPLHLIGNMLFLMVLGARVNALVGNILTLAIYPLLAICAAGAQLASVQGDQPMAMLGASGAVMGLAGMYFILMPAAHVHMAAWWRWGLVGGFQLNLKMWAVRGIWVVLFYIAFDVAYTALQMEDGVAHWAHLGGFIAGAVIALVLLFSRLVNARGGDLLSWVLGPYAWGLIGRPNRPAWSLW